MKTTENWQTKQLGMNTVAFFIFSAFVKLFPKKEEKKECNSIMASFFTYSEKGNKVDAKIVFRNQSKCATAYVWDFGDGNVSTEENPVHIYEAPGTYVVKLIAVSDHGSDSEKQLIEID